MCVACGSLNLVEEFMRYTRFFFDMRIFEHVMIPGKVAPFTTLLARFRADNVPRTFGPKVLPLRSE